MNKKLQGGVTNKDKSRICMHVLKRVTWEKIAQMVTFPN
jgi:hypothetical protein